MVVNIGAHCHYLILFQRLKNELIHKNKKERQQEKIITNGRIHKNKREY